MPARQFRSSLISYDKSLMYERVAAFSMRSAEELYANLNGCTFSPYDRDMVYLIYAFGAVTIDLLIYLRRKDQFLPFKFRSRESVKQTLSRLVDGGYVSHWQCNRERLASTQEQNAGEDHTITETVYDFYTVSEKIAEKLEKRHGTDLSSGCERGTYTPCLLAAAQASAVLLAPFKHVPANGELHHGILNFSQMPYFRVKYKGYWNLYVFAVRQGLENYTAQLSDATSFLKEHIRDSRVIMVCDSSRSMIETAERLLDRLKRTELYGVLFMDDFGYVGREGRVLEVYKNAEGMNFKPVDLF